MTTWMLKHRAVLAAGAVILVWFILLTGVLLPLLQTTAALNDAISREEAEWAALQTGVKMAAVSPRVGRVFRGPQALLAAARQANVSAVSVDAPKAGSEVYQISGEASLSAFADWLARLSRLSPGFNLSKVDLSVQTDGRLHFSLSTTGGNAEAESAAEPAWPVGNPFCHTASLDEALQAAAVPPLQRYPLSDVHWIGRARLGSVVYAVFALPGGVTVSATLGDAVGQVKARLLSVGPSQLTLQLQNGQVLSFKQSKEI